MFLPLTCARVAKNMEITQFKVIILFKNNFMVDDCKLLLLLLFSVIIEFIIGISEDLEYFDALFSSTIIQVLFISKFCFIY